MLPIFLEQSVALFRNRNTTFRRKVESKESKVYLLLQKDSLSVQILTIALIEKTTEGWDALRGFLYIADSTRQTLATIWESVALPSG